MHTPGGNVINTLGTRPREPYSQACRPHIEGITSTSTSLFRQHQRPHTHHSELPKLLLVVMRVSHPRVMGVASRAIYVPTAPMLAHRVMRDSITISRDKIMHQTE